MQEVYLNNSIHELYFNEHPDKNKTGHHWPIYNIYKDNFTLSKNIGITIKSLQWIYMSDTQFISLLDVARCLLNLHCVLWGLLWNSTITLFPFSSLSGPCHRPHRCRNTPSQTTQSQSWGLACKPPWSFGLVLRAVVCIRESVCDSAEATGKKCLDFWATIHIV